MLHLGKSFLGEFEAMAIRGLHCVLNLFCLLCLLASSICLEASPCHAKAIIRQWSSEPSPEPRPIATDAVFTPRFSPSPRPTPQPLPKQATSDDGRTALGITLAYYGSNPGVFAKGCFGTYTLSPLLSIRSGVLTGNTPILVPTSANLYEYSSFLRVPVALVAKWHFLYGGMQVSRTWVDTYNQAGYAVTSFEPILGLAFGPGPFYLSLDASYPPFDPAIPLVVSLSIGGRF